jgi:hypothetical protein
MTEETQPLSGAEVQEKAREFASLVLLCEADGNTKGRAAVNRKWTDFLLNLPSKNMKDKARIAYFERIERDSPVNDGVPRKSTS